MVFGPFAFDDLSGELRKHGVRLRLQGQPLQILTALIRQSGQIVTRDEFQHELWTYRPPAFSASEKLPSAYGGF